MSTSFESVEKEAMTLPDSEKVVLVEHLVSSLSDPELNEVEAAWVREAERRYREYNEGKRPAIPEREFFSGIREELDG